MVTSAQIVRDLTESKPEGTDVLRALRLFATEFGWKPSDELARYAGTETFCNGHLVVEHGFDQTAVISFLRSDTPFAELSLHQRRQLLELSYNNLVDWHFMPERAGMRVVYNRNYPPQDVFFPLTSTDEVWRSRAFEMLTGKRPSSNVKRLDDALIQTVSFWKRAIQSDIGETVTLREISSMINSVILVRGLEDYKNRHQASDRRLLLDSMNGLSPGKSAYRAINAALQSLGQVDAPPWLAAMITDLRAFDGWENEAVRELFDDFYLGRDSVYRYNFHLISKHALSRIYEHYVSLLRDNKSPQMSLFRTLPTEVRNKDLGSVYTPQYIARFFAKYAREHRTPRSFRNMKTMDPACGSGMFLRTLLELQCDPTNDDSTPSQQRSSFSNTLGIDIDDNACQAARLSLALLHLVLTGSFPADLKIVCADAIDYLEDSNTQSFDTVIANPPFVKWDGLPQRIRDSLSTYMMDTGLGKQDLYLAFLKKAVEHTAAGGLLCFVLPHSFLLSRSGEELRARLSSEFTIRVLADLSEVAVFQQTGIYVVLLIAEKLRDPQAPAMVMKCREFVGEALQEVLAGRVRNGDGYEIFQLPQAAFGRKRWSLLQPDEDAVRRLFDEQPKLDSIVDVHQGIVTGMDDVFIRASRECPKGERSVWVPLLQDRDMLRFTVPERQAYAVFMPFDADGKRLAETELRKSYPETWLYLRKHKAKLEGRAAVIKSSLPWWSPERPRTPATLLVPKIVTPHLVLLPRFGVDSEGKYAVSRSPYLVPKTTSSGTALLKVICAVMNSAIGHWQLASSSHKYSRGYLMLEVRTLREFRLPEPAAIPSNITRRIINLFDKMIDSPEDRAISLALDIAVSDAYGLSESQRAAIGVVG